jgi:hypothetical protein
MADEPVLSEGALRLRIATELEERIRPLISLPRSDGYNCCGCSTYDQILDDAISLVMGKEPPWWRMREISRYQDKRIKELEGQIAILENH